MLDPQRRNNQRFWGTNILIQNSQCSPSEWNQSSLMNLRFQATSPSNNASHFTTLQCEQRFAKAEVFSIFRNRNPGVLQSSHYSESLSFIEHISGFLESTPQGANIPKHSFAWRKRSPYHPTITPDCYTFILQGGKSASVAEPPAASAFPIRCLSIWWNWQRSPDVDFKAGDIQSGQTDPVLERLHPVAHLPIVIIILY